MLYWICPECGHECSPAIRECPTCTAAEKSAPIAAERKQATEAAEQTSTEILTLAQNFESAPATGMLSAASYRNLVAGANGHAAPVAAAVIDDEPTVELLPEIEAPEAPAAAEKETDTHIDSLVKPLVDSVKPKEPPASTTLAPLDGLAVKPSHPTPAHIAVPVVSPVPPRPSAPAVIAAEIAKPESNLDMAGLTPAGDITFEASPGWQPKPEERLVEPVPSRRRSIAFLRAALQGADKSELALADLTAAELELTPALAATYPESEGAAHSLAALTPAPQGLAFITSKIDFKGASLSEILRALERSAEDLEQSAIRAIQASFGELPTAPLLAAPLEIVTAPAPPADQWLRLPKLVFTPQPPSKAGLTTLSAGPQTPTLAGPCLPAQLQNFTGGTLNRAAPRKRSGAPTWMISVLVATCLFLGAGSLLQYLSANRDTHAASTSASPFASETASAATQPVAQEHPGARFIEVAGLRVVAAANKRAQLQYIVIYHSSGELTGINIRITVHTPDSPSGPPLFSVSTVVPSLAANQSKEIRTDLDAGLKAASIPGWQTLHPEIQITRQ
jgi:hypothetical protein